MRILIAVCLLLASVCTALAQVAAPNLFTTVRPDATVRVHRHPLGADIVVITLLDQNYPPDVLKSQIAQLGEYLKNPPTAVLVQYDSLGLGGKSHYLRATFGIQGLTDPDRGIYRLEPIARALAGAPEGHEIRGIMVLFEGSAPKDKVTLENFGLAKGSPVSVMGQYGAGPIGLEYRIALNTQDRSKIVIPETSAPTTTEATAVSPAPAPPSTPWLLYGSAVLFALAMGALVYSLTLRHSRSGPSGASKKHSTGTFRHR